MPASKPRALPHRLRELRKRHWPDVSLTQRELARALGVSPPSISSWEKVEGEAVPPPERIAAYAAFFATRRSVETKPYKLLREGELTEQEQVVRDALERELSAKRRESLRASPMRVAPVRLGGPLQFPDDDQITIASSEVPPAQVAELARPEDPARAYGKLYSHADIDALFELHGHVRAANPLSRVEVRKASEMEPDELTGHLVLVGGVDWNEVTRRLLDALEIPVRQISAGGNPADDYFVVTDREKERRFQPELTSDGLVAMDIGHFFRGSNPLNRERVLIMCNAMFSLGTLGVARTLTDERFRERNARYLSEHFAGQESYSLLMKVMVVEDNPITPDWTYPGTVLHRWPSDDNL